MAVFASSACRACSTDTGMVGTFNLFETKDFFEGVTYMNLKLPNLESLYQEASYSRANSLSCSSFTKVIMENCWPLTDFIPVTKVSEDHSALRKRLGATSDPMGKTKKNPRNGNPWGKYYITTIIFSAIRTIQKCTSSFKGILATRPKATRWWITPY